MSLCDVEKPRLSDVVYKATAVVPVISVCVSNVVIVIIIIMLLLLLVVVV